jgi:hypothetical protein
MICGNAAHTNLIPTFSYLATIAHPVANASDSITFVIASSTEQDAIYNNFKKKA